MNILHITTFLQGGAGRIITDLALMQKDEGNNVVIALDDREELGYSNYKEYLTNLKNHNIELYFLNSTFKREIYLNVNAAFKISSILSDYKIDLIHAHASTPAMVAILGSKNSIKRIPVIQTMHGWGTNKNLNQEKMDVSIMHLIDKVVTVSNSDKALLINKGVSPKKIDTIYNGVSKDINYILEDYRTIEIIQEKKKKKYVIFGCVGTICERKNQKLIIEALRYDSSINGTIIFIGEGEDIVELRNLVNEYKLSDKILFLGYKEEAYNYYQYFDYMILPSLSEGLPLTIIESFRSGIPVIASDIDIFKEIIADQNQGFIFKGNDYINLADRIKHSISIYNKSEYLNMRKKCIKTYNEKFELKEMYNRYHKIYNKLVSSIN